MANIALLTSLCALGELLPGKCAPGLHSHHVWPISLGGPVDGKTVPMCPKHHPMLEKLARRELGWKSCPHRPGVHRYPGAREACEAQINAAA